jgi:hypothetical protein
MMPWEEDRLRRDVEYFLEWLEKQPKPPNCILRLRTADGAQLTMKWDEPYPPNRYVRLLPVSLNAALAGRAKGQDPVFRTRTYRLETCVRRPEKDKPAIWELREEVAE